MEKGGREEVEKYKLPDLQVVEVTSKKQRSGCYLGKICIFLYFINIIHGRTQIIKYGIKYNASFISLFR